MENMEILSLLLPKELLEYFDITAADKNKDSYVIYLEEKNISPEKYKDNKLASKGFYDPVTVQDFPLRGKACYLKVKRRRWTNLDTGTIVMRDWNLVASGTRITQEFASFLKGLNRQ